IAQQPTGGVRQNARQNDQINPSTTIPTTQVPAAVRSSRLSCGKVGKAQNIHLSSGVIWGIPGNIIRVRDTSLWALLWNISLLAKRLSNAEWSLCLQRTCL